MERSRDWMRQAEHDLEKSRHDLEHDYFGWACFTAHQAAEKAVKAVHQSRNRSVRGHGLVQLLKSLKDDPAAPEEALHAGRVLDRSFTASRSPDGLSVENLDPIIAQEAVDAADGVVRFCRRHLG